MYFKKILFAEDSLHDVELTMNALATESLANDVEVVSDGVEALEYLRYEGRFAGRAHGNPVLVLLDLKMPRLDGLEVLKAIRADKNLSHLPVVILTSSREEADIAASYQLGTNAYVVKPVDFEQFVAAIVSLGVFWAVVNDPPPQPDGD